MFMSLQESPKVFRGILLSGDICSIQDVRLEGRSAPFLEISSFAPGVHRFGSVYAEHVK